MDDNENEDCIPILTDANQGLEANEVVDYLVEAATKHKEFLNPALNPPVQPNGGTVFLFDLGPNETQWEANKKKLRYAYIRRYMHACMFFACIQQAISMLNGLFRAYKRA